jgi:IMP and pyridine-specific 5'-nucleotidase
MLLPSSSWRAASAPSSSSAAAASRRAVLVPSISSSSTTSSGWGREPRAPPPPSVAAAAGRGAGPGASSARSRSSTRSRSPDQPARPARRTRQKSSERNGDGDGNGNGSTIANGNGRAATPRGASPSRSAAAANANNANTANPNQTTTTATTTTPGPPPSNPSPTPSPFSSMMELVSNPDIDEAVARAPSASDAAVLRRKGHLKEQDRLIEFMRDMHATHTCMEVMAKVERWVADHRQDPRRSRLRRVVPTVGSFFTPLGLVDAFREYDAVFHLSCRRYIPPNFAELRHVLNIAQVRASAEGLRLVTFDADGTLYADGHHIEQDSAMVEMIVSLMRAGVHVGIVTAAGYPGDASKFEGRIAGLLRAFDLYDLPPELTARFHLMGGECNYLLRVARRPGSGPGGGIGGGGGMVGGLGVGGTAAAFAQRFGAAPASSASSSPPPHLHHQRRQQQHHHRLEFVPDEEWQTPEMLAWDPDEVVRLLDAAQRELLRGAERLCLPVSLIRKTRSVGVVPAAPTIYEVLEELALTVQQQLSSKLPFCAFNGGNDVFVDVGNKSLGLDALMRHLGCYPHETLHVGDRFTDSGNDTATRDCCSIVWVANPEETSFFMRLLLRDLEERGRGAGGGGVEGNGAAAQVAPVVGMRADADLAVGGDGRRGDGRKRRASTGRGSALSSRDGG